MTNERLNTLLYNAIICLEEYGCDGKQLELDIGITEEEYEKIINIDDSSKNQYLERCFIFSDGYGVIILEKTNWKEVHYNGNKMEIYMEFFVCFFILIII